MLESEQNGKSLSAARKTPKNGKSSLFQPKSGHKMVKIARRPPQAAGEKMVKVTHFQIGGKMVKVVAPPETLPPPYGVWYFGKEIP